MDNRLPKSAKKLMKNKIYQNLRYFLKVLSYWFRHIHTRILCFFRRSVFLASSLDLLRKFQRIEMQRNERTIDATRSA